MRKVEAAGRSVMRLAYLAAGVALMAVVVLAAVYEERSREAFRQSARAEVQDRLGLLRSDLQGTLNANAETARALAGVVRYQPDIDQAAVRAARGGADRRPAVHSHTSRRRRIWWSAWSIPWRKTRWLSASTIGRRRSSTRRRSGRGTSTRRCWPDRSTSIQGGTGFIVRAPVFVDGGEGAARRFWGIVSAVIDEEALYRAAG